MDVALTVYLHFPLPEPHLLSVLAIMTFQITKCSHTADIALPLYFAELHSFLVAVSLTADHGPVTKKTG